MTYTVAELDQWMTYDFEFERQGYYGPVTYTADDGSLWSLLKYQDANDVPSPFGVISYVANYGGEGKGDEYWVVVKIAGHDGTERYFRKDGWYASYSGGELDGETYEVRPREKMVTVYE